MRYCGLFDPVALGRVTLKQLSLMMQAVRLKLQDEMRGLHMAAWLNAQVKATRQQGKKTVPYYGSFDEFYEPRDETVHDAEKTVKNGQKNAELNALILKANTK